MKQGFIGRECVIGLALDGLILTEQRAMMFAWMDHDHREGLADGNMLLLKRDVCLNGSGSGEVVRWQYASVEA